MAANSKIGQPQLRHDHGSQDRDREPVDKVDNCREEDEAGDPPAQAGYAYPGHPTWREHLMVSFHREARC